MNQRTHNIIAAVIGVAFLVIIQLFSNPAPVFRYLAPAFLGYVVVVAGYDYWYLKRQGKFNLWLWLRAILFLPAWFGFFFLIPNQFLQGLFLLISAGLIYFFQVSLGKTGEQVLFNQVLLTAFGFFMFLVAFSSYFPLNGVLYSGLLVIFLILLSRASFELTPASSRNKWLGAIILSIIIGELFWSLGFLPLHYSVLALLLFNFFYFAWTLYYYHLFKLLTQRKIEFQLGLLITFSLVILLATRFAPITS